MGAQVSWSLTFQLMGLAVCSYPMSSNSHSFLLTIPKGPVLVPLPQGKQEEEEEVEEQEEEEEEGEGVCL